MATIPPGAQCEVFDPCRRFTQAEAQRLSEESGLTFIAVQRIEDQFESYILDPSQFSDSMSCNRKKT
jgi:hypothetical protein